MREISALIGNYNETAESAMRSLDLANGYRPFVAAMPEAAALSVPALSTYTPRVSVPAESWLWAISASSQQAAGFTLQITDAATRKPLFSQPVSFDNATAQGSLSVTDCYGAAHTLKNPLHFLPRPLAILAPGLLTVQVVNLAAVDNRLQVCLHFALPTQEARGPHRNEYNAELDREIETAMRAQRDEGSSVTATGAAGSTGKPARLAEPITTPFDVAIAGDNVIIGGNSAGRIAIYQLDLWNVAQQDIELRDGTTTLRGPLASYPAQSGYSLPQAPDAHYRLTPGRPFVLNLSAGTRVTGSVKYRIE